MGPYGFEFSCDICNLIAILLSTSLSGALLTTLLNIYISSRTNISIISTKTIIIIVNKHCRVAVICFLLSALFAIISTIWGDYRIIPLLVSIITLLFAFIALLLIPTKLGKGVKKIEVKSVRKEEK